MAIEQKKKKFDQKETKEIPEREEIAEQSERKRRFVDASPVPQKIKKRKIDTDIGNGIEERDEI